jgi:hypothetical protein
MANWTPLTVARRWVAPVIVPAVIALSLAAVVDEVNGTDKPRGKAAKASAAKTPHPGVRPAGETALPSAGSANGPQPRYIVGVRRSGAAAVVRDVRTFAPLGGVAAPAKRRFSQVAVAGSGSYLISSVGPRGGGGVAFHRLRVGNDGKPAALTALPRVRLPGRSTAWSDMAVTPDGRTLAYATYGDRTTAIDVVSVATGARRTYTTSHTGRIGGLSWAGRALSFVWTPMRGGKVLRRQVRSLDTRSRPGDLKVSRPVLALPNGAETAVASRDGKTIVMGMAGQTGPILAAYSSTAGGQAGLLWRRQVGDPAHPVRPTRLTRLTPDGSGGHIIAGGSDGLLFVVPAVGAAEFRAADLADLAW